ncbi:MAG TPA: inositol monophosphatase family protein, partial [Devosia sp.]|nr:inositol monophosphatase family protein [Devosia sp.]
MAFDPQSASPAAPAALARSAALMAIAREAALLVRAPLLAAFRSVMDIDYKVDLHDLVTVHDKQTELTLRNFIFERAPDSTFMGEEGGSVGTGPVHWYVDPIDGTSNFARGMAF